MRKIKVAINGFGRIGRNTLRALLQKNTAEVVAVNDLTDSKTLAHLFKYDSVHGVFAGQVNAEAGGIWVEGKYIQVFSEREIEKLPWKHLEIDVVIESTGLYLDQNTAGKHLQAGAKKVIISAPAKDNTKTIVLGINDHLLSAEDRIVSNASCTTNCAAPMLKVLDDHWGIEYAYISTVHSYTGDQRLHDAPHKDLRRARAAALSIVPTSTGAAKAITRIFPHLHGKVGGCGIRVPVPNGSLTDISCILRKDATVQAINAAFQHAATTHLKGILQYIEEPIVSADIVGSPYSCILDAEFTSVVGKIVKVIGWYDNEAGYAHRLADLVERLFNKP